ncbi:MAG TPA: phosphotransferase [Vicinamibacterales bacterium]
MTKRAAIAALPDRVQAYLRRSGLEDRAVTVHPLTGDASDRRYFRVLRRGEQPVVIALHAAPFDADTLPFVQVARLLAKMQLPIPRILDRAGDLGILVVEDLGDVTLQAHVGAAPAGEHNRLYREAVALIEVLQSRGAELASPEYPPYTIAFDVEKLLWELDFFTKHFLEAYRGACIQPAAREALRDEWRKLAEELAAEPRVLCHRDYHSRNLMLHEGELYVIDFQDARLGPDTYDLVSLLRDSYVDLPEETVEELIDYFIALKRPRGTNRRASREWEEDFRRRFDVMALQRNLKALGTFGYQTVARGNSVYIQYIPRTLRYVAANLARRDGTFGRLRELLAQYLEELR